MSTRRAVLLVAALAALAVAAVLVVSPVADHGVDCGTPLATSAIEPTDGEGGEYVTSSSCDRAADRRKTTALVLAGVGTVLLVGVVSKAEWVERPWGHTTSQAG